MKCCLLISEHPDTTRGFLSLLSFSFWDLLLACTHLSISQTRTHTSGSKGPRFIKDGGFLIYRMLLQKSPCSIWLLTTCGGGGGTAHLMMSRLCFIVEGFFVTYLAFCRQLSDPDSAIQWGSVYRDPSSLIWF